MSHLDGKVLAERLIGSFPSELVDGVTVSELTAQIDDLLHGERALWKCYVSKLITLDETAAALVDRLHAWLQERRGGDWLRSSWDGAPAIPLVREWLTERQLVQTLLDAVHQLAASARQQAHHLSKLGFAPCADELALDLDAVLDAALPLVPQRARKPLQRLDALLEAMSGIEHAALWTTDALVHAPQWAEIREAARAAIAAITGQQPE